MGGASVQGQAKKQTESKKRLELLPSRDSCWSFFPTGSAERPGIAAAVGAGAAGSVWRDFGMALVLCGIKTPPKGSWWAELGWWELFIQLCSRSSAGEGRNSMEKLRGRGEDRETLPHHS